MKGVSMRSLLIISIIVSVVFHSTLFYGFSGAVLFNMDAYNSKIQSLLEIGVDSRSIPLGERQELDESINIPEDAPILKETVEEMIDRSRIKESIQESSQTFDDKQRIKKTMAELQPDLGTSQSSVNEDFRLRTQKKISDKQSGRSVQKSVQSDYVVTPQRKKSVRLGRASVEPGAESFERNVVNTRSTFYAGGGSTGESFFTGDAVANKPSFKNVLVFQEASDESRLALQMIKVNQGKLKVSGDMRDYIGTEFIVYEDPVTKEHFIRLILTPRPDVDYSIISKDILFLIDVSGSISKDKLRRIKTEIEECLKFQNKGDRFNIVLFSVNQEQLYVQFKEINEETIKEAHEFINRIRGSRETDIYQALMNTVPFFALSQRILHIAFISDARPTEGVKDYRKIINDFSRRRIGNVAFFTYDIGKGRKRFLLNYLSYENRGDSFKKDITGQEGTLPYYLKQYNWPFLYNIKIDSIEGENLELYPKLLKHFYLNKPIELYAKLNRKGSLAVQLSGKDHLGVRREMFIALNSDVAKYSEERRIAQQWAQMKLYELISVAFREGVTKELKDSIADHRKKYRLRIAWELNKYLK